MKYVFFGLLIIFSTNLFAQNNILSTEELQKIAFKIKTEGLLLYRSERTSWLGTDLFLEKYTGKRDDIGGYFSYQDGASSKCIFYSKGNDRKVIGTVNFNDVILDDKNLVNISERDFTPLEKKYVLLRDSAMKIILNDTNVKHYNNSNINLVSVIDENRQEVYIITATSLSDRVLYGNDYLLKFDNNFKLLSVSPLHRGLIPVSRDNSDSAAGHIHTHLPEFSPFITATDICTTLLYMDFLGKAMCNTISKEYISFWNSETMSLIIIPNNKNKR